MASESISSRRTAPANRESSHQAKQTVRLSAKPPPPQLSSVARGSSYYEHKDLEAVWLSEFLSHEKKRNEEIAKKDLLNFIDLPGSTIPSINPHVANHPSVKGRKPSLKDRAQGSMLDHKPQYPCELASNELVESKRAKKSKRERKKLTPYMDANSKISRVLQHTKLKGKKEDMQSSQLNDFFKIVTRETSAVIILQSQCRRVLATEIAKNISIKTKQATKIQCFVRGCFARELLKRMKEEKHKATHLRNQLVRLYVARCRRRKLMKLEHNAAVICQYFIRMVLAKQAVQLRRCQHLWELNQKRWKTVSIRLAWAGICINVAARAIQCILRCKSAQRRVSRTLALHSKAVVCIQSIWRRYVARQKKSEIVYKLNVDERCSKIRILASEYQYRNHQHEDFSKPSKLQHRRSLEIQRDILEKEQREKCEEIHALETHYRDQLWLQEQITPRAVFGGWEEQVKINLKDTRERITMAKLSMVFNVQKKLESVLKEIDQVKQDEAKTKASRDHWRTWLQVEQDRLWDFQRQHDTEIAEKEKRHSRVSEQLHWSVDFYNFSGKPDKRTRLKTSENSCAGESVIERLLYHTKLKTDEYQAISHLACMYQPFLGQYNALAKTGTGAGEKSKPRKALHVEAIPQLKPSRSAPQHIFQKKLPWGLLKEKRRDREEITAKFKS